MSAQPYMPLYFGDFLASTAEWTGEEQALYLILLGHQWSLGSLPNDPEKVRRLSRWEKRAFTAAWETVQSKFVERDGRLVNERLEEHRARSEEIGRKRADAAAKRWSKPAAEAPQEHKQTDSKSHANASPDASSLHVIACADARVPDQTRPDEEKKDPLRGSKESAREARARPARRCPTEFAITPEMRAWAAANTPAVNLERETAAFRDHEYRAAKTDWPAAWRTWMRKAGEYHGATNGNSSQRNSTRPSAVERVYRATEPLLGSGTDPSSESLAGHG